MPREAYIYDAVRTPRGKGKKDGSLHGVKPVNLLAGLLEQLQARNNLDTSRVDDVVMGCVSPVGEQGMNIAKTAVMVAGWDNCVAGVQVNRYCASGIETANMAAMKVNSGWEDLVVVGGVESMSRVPLGSDGGAWTEDPEFNSKLGFLPQGIGADMVATMNDFSREDVDSFALQSQKKAASAQANGYFDRSVIPVLDVNGLMILAKDEYIKPDCNMEGLSGLKPSFSALAEMGFSDIARRKYPEISKINHVHTPGNSSGIVDGASALLVGNENIGKELGLQPRARIIGGAVTSTEPVLMMTGPVPATRKALEKAGLKASDIDLFEVNEAFASIPLLFAKEMGVSLDQINVNGGAIALGHPLGATGGMMIGTLVDELERRNLRRGLATVCAGAGIGIAIIIERV